MEYIDFVDWIGNHRNMVSASLEAIKRNSPFMLDHKWRICFGRLRVAEYEGVTREVIESDIFALIALVSIFSQDHVAKLGFFRVRQRGYKTKVVFCL